MAGIPTPAEAQHEQHGVPAANAQVVLTGTAFGAEGTPLSGAIVQLLHGSPTELDPIATSLSDATGRFAIPTVGGTYTLDISYPGHASHRQRVTLATASLHVGNVRLELRPIELDPVTASAQPVAVELRTGATIVNPRVAATAGGSIADLLRGVPGLELDADGRISIRGSSAVLVLMNGRPIPLTGNALAAFLSRMPAAALERVEAGTTASARQAADGTAGVVNLVFRTAEQRRTDMRSLAGSVATDDHYTGSAAATGAVGDILDWDVMYSMSSMLLRTDTRTARWSLVPGDLPLRTDQDSHASEEHRLHSVLAGAAVAPTTNTSVGLRGTYSWMEGGYRNRSAFAYTNSAGSTGTSTTGSWLEHVIPSGELSAVASLSWGMVRLTSEASVSFMDEDLSGAYDDERGGYRYLTTAMASRQDERVLKNELRLRLAGLDVEVGQESRFRTLTAAHAATHFGATVSQTYRYDRDLHAAYLTTQATVGDLSAEAGLRVESDRTRIQLETASARTDVQVFPNISGVWADAGRDLLFRIAYGRRINRPGSEMLNPFSMGGDDMNEIVGNPSLLPEVSDQVELGVERHRSRWSLQLTPFLRWSRNPIRQIKAATASGGATTRLENLTRTRAVGADASLRGRPTDGTVVTVAGSLAQMETTADAFSSSGVIATARLTVDLQLAASTTAQIYAYGRSAQAIEQGEILPAFTSELALTQRLAGDRGRVTLRLNDPLRSDRLAFRIADPTFTQESRRRTERPLLSLFASYAVGGEPREEAPVRMEGPARIF